MTNPPTPQLDDQAPRAPAGCAGLQMPRAKAHREVRDEGVFRFTRAVRHEDAPPTAGFPNEWGRWDGKKRDQNQGKLRIKLGKPTTVCNFG